MNRNWLPFLCVTVLLALLAVLALLQYRWLGQISEIESARLSERLKDDTGRFASDFNREIQNAYHNFEMQSDQLSSGDFRAFNKRFLFWKQQARYPGLIGDIYYISGPENANISKFDSQKASFDSSEWTAQLTEIKKVLSSKADGKRIVNDSLVMPLFKKGPDITRLIVTRTEGKNDEINQEQHLALHENDGYLVITLDRKVLGSQLLPALRQKYFSQEGGGEFDVAVIDQNGELVYSTSGNKFNTGDAAASLLSVSGGDINFFWKDRGNLTEGDFAIKRERVVVNGSLAKRTIQKMGNDIVSDELQGPATSDSDVRIMDRVASGSPGEWKMFVRHSSGSLDAFVAYTRYKNLGISFGILGVLAAGMVLILISTQRSRTLARRQLEFVSSVSHEFRTPLAVIMAAGENILDGVVGTPEKLADYGRVIKKEGRKLSGMVEQILQYAGADSGKRRFDFKELEVLSVIEEVLKEYEPLITKNGFVLERDLGTGLPLVSADPDALRTALQNLLANALKYSDTEKWIRVTAGNGGGNVIISVGDRGIGITTEDQRNIFEPFFRANSVVEQQISGNGLGLSLVKRIIDAHGGTISVSSEIGSGSIFTISIPAASTR